MTDRSWWRIVLTQLVLFGCVHDPRLDNDAETTRLIEAYRQKSTEIADERARRDATSIRQLSVEGSGSVDAIVSVDLRDAPAARVVSEILDRSGAPYEMTNVPLNGRVTVRFSKLPLVHALNRIVNRRGYSIVMEDGLLAFRYGGPVAPANLTPTAGEPGQWAYEEVPLGHIGAPEALALLSSLFGGSSDDADADGGSLAFGSVDELNAIYLAGPPDAVAGALGILNRSDREAPHVLIEAIVVDMESQAAAQLGAQFSDIAKGRLSGGSVAPSTGRIALSFLDTDDNPLSLSASIDLLVTQGKAQILSRPFIVARSRQRANIEVVEEQFVSVERSVGGASVTAIDGVSAGVTLAMTPAVMAENKIRIDLELERSQFIPVVGDALVAKDRNTASTSVTIADGQTIVIGGLKSKLLSTVNSGVPWLRRVPLLDFLTAGRTGRQANTEVVLYLTPHIWVPGMDLPLVSQDVPEYPNALLTPFERFGGQRPRSDRPESSSAGLMGKEVRD